jgi:SAM-dependent methyltransferase
MNTIVNLAHPNADLLIELLPNGRKLLTMRRKNADLFILRQSITTSYPVELIAHIFSVKGPSYACDEIARDEDPAYVRESLETDLFAYFSPDQFVAKRILDFGCGSGASTMVLKRLLPKTTVIGVELDPTLLSIARARAEHYKFPQENLLQSPSGKELPPGLGKFDFVVLSAVYEHMLPGERSVVLEQVWSSLREGGYLFLNQTPHRFTPFESHTTQLPLINYLPDRLALAAARSFSEGVARDETWNTLLRRGIRGSTEYEILRKLKHCPGGRPVLMRPNRNGLHDRIDLWRKVSMRRLPVVKNLMWLALKSLKLCSGVTFVPTLSLAIHKSSHVSNAIA